MFRRDMLGLVLTAGGARGAYQAGVLKRIGEIRALRGRPSPFAIVAGPSAGAINGAISAARSGDSSCRPQRRAHAAADLSDDYGLRSDVYPLRSGSLRWLRDLTLGRLLGGGTVQSLLDATPLRAHTSVHLPIEGIGQAIRDGHLYAVAVSATSYHSGKSYTFIQGKPGH